MRVQLAPVLLGLVWLAASCGDDAPSTTASATARSTEATPDITTGADVIDPGDGGSYSVDVDPARFSSTIDHPYLPKLPGTRWVFESRTPDGEIEDITVEVLDESRTVMGVETIVVHDVVEVDGEVIEDTYDWFAQDDEGNVWYFGEDTTAYEDGVASSEGAWEAGVDGALPGIVMPAEPEVDDTGYRQEYLAGEAEDMGQIIGVGRAVEVPAGSWDDTVVTRDWTPLEPDVVEEKTYARDVGFVYEIKPAGEGAGEEVVLVEFIPGS